MKKLKKLIKALKDYKVLIIIFISILLYVALRYVLAPYASPEKFMNDFMAGFFLSFGILQINNLESTKKSLKKYDPLAKKFNWYAEIYPFVFLFFGVALHTNSLSTLISAITIPMLGIQTLGIIKTLKSGNKIEFACIGTKFSLPLSYVTVVENGIAILISLLIIIFNFL